MTTYRLTPRGKLVVATLCTFIGLCIFLGISLSKQDAPIYYDYNPPTNSQQQADIPPAPTAQPVKDEAWKKLEVTVYFEPDLSSVDLAYHKSLGTFSIAALQHSEAKIQVEGNCATQFAENPSQKAINYNLSLLRAQAVADYLTKQGINADRLIVVANGSDKPLKDNSTPEGRKFNRRVDVFFVK